MGFDFSVIVLTYHPVKEKLLATLNSIIAQKNCRFEIIISDDGSEEFFEKEIRDYMDSHGFENYRIVMHEKNLGTVNNLLRTKDMAGGKYIKPISPGDFLYNENTLSDVLSFMDAWNAKAAFGDMVYYSLEGKLQISNVKTPVDDAMYLPRNSSYDFKKVLKHQMIFSDNISGAAAFYERNCFYEGLETIRDTVRYAEDSILQLMAVQNIRLYKIPQNLIWYEYGSGISTSPNQGFAGKLRKDFYGFYQMLHQKFSDAPYVKRNYFNWKIMMESGSAINLLRRCANVDRLAFLMKRRRLLSRYACEDYDTAFLEELLK